MNKLGSLADVLERTVFDMKEQMDILSKLWRINSDGEHFSLAGDCLCLVWDLKKKNLQFCSFRPSKPVPFPFMSIYSICSVSFSQRTVCFSLSPWPKYSYYLYSYLIWMLDERYFPLLYMISPLFSLNELFLERNLNPG